MPDRSTMKTFYTRTIKALNRWFNDKVYAQQELRNVAADEQHLRSKTSINSRKLMKQQLFKCHHIAKLLPVRSYLSKHSSRFSFSAIFLQGARGLAKNKPLLLFLFSPSTATLSKQAANGAKPNLCL